MDLLASRIHRPPLSRESTCPVHGLYLSRCHLGDIWTKCSLCADEAKAKEEAQAQDEQKRRTRAEWEKRLGTAAIPERFHGCRLRTYIAETPEQQAALHFAKDYADSFSAVRRSGRGAIFVGNVGTGKTHLAVGIGLQVMHTHGATVLFSTVARAVRRIKDTWSKRSTESEGEAVATLVFPDLLILDEVGVQFGSDFEKNLLFDVLNERYEKRKPTLFLSNLSIEGVALFLGERVMDRLREDGGDVLPFQWDSYRAKGSAQRGHA